MNTPQTLADVLKALMDQCLDEDGKPITQNRLADDLASISSVSQATLSRIITGKSRYPEHPTVLALANYWGVTPAQMRAEEPIDWASPALRRSPIIRPEVTQPGTSLRRIVEEVQQAAQKAAEHAVSEKLAQYGLKIEDADATPVGKEPAKKKE